MHPGAHQGEIGKMRVSFVRGGRVKAKRVINRSGTADIRLRSLWL